MSHTTTAASSAARHHHLSFATWLPPCLADDLGNQLPAPIEEEPTPRLDVTALCRRTFVHLESASPLARLSQSELLRSFRDFSARIQEKVGVPTVAHRRRHTLTPAVIEGDEGLAGEAAVRIMRWQPSAGEVAHSPLARMLKRRGLDHVSKDDAYTPNLKRCPSDSMEEASALQQSRELSTRVSEVLLEFPMPRMDGDMPQLELGRLSRSGMSHYSASSLVDHSDATPTPAVDYAKGLFFPSISPNASPLLTSGDPDSAEPSLLPHICNTPLDSCGVESSGARSPSKLRPLADLLETPWQQDGGDRKETSVPTTHPPTPRTPDCFLKEWIATLPVHTASMQDDVSLHDRIGCLRVCRGSLSFFITHNLKPAVVSVFASTLAQSLITPAAEQKAKEQSQVKSEEGAANCGHPHGCKPCAFFWSKGCLNGDDCRFCHEWHAPKRKKPMKDQKNLMIIAREDGKIAFLRCAVEDVLKHH